MLFETLNCRGKALSLPVFLLDDADALAGVNWSVKVRAYDCELRLIKAEEFPGGESIPRLRHVGDFRLTPDQSDTAPLLIVAEAHCSGQLADRTFYFVNFEAEKDSLFQLPRTTLALSVAPGEATIRNTGPWPAVGAAVLRLGHLATFSASDNYFWLEPGESKSIRVSDTHGLTVNAWNVES